HDDGPGVSPEEAERIFGDASHREGGAGIGLKHARAVARSAGGDLHLLPPGEAGLAGDAGGGGACFRIRWPRVEPAVASAPVSAVRSAVLAGTRVLIVEDDNGVAELLESALRARGATVDVARSASDLAHQASFQHDAALVDLSPIAHDVRGAVDMIRRGSPEVAIVLISGSLEQMPDGLDGEGIRWVNKPFEIPEIIAALVESGLD
ncbi:MAG: ATP-binding protein, partial [Polyangiaceae bacterium]